MPDSKINAIDILSEETVLRDLCSRSFYSFFQEFWQTIESVDLALNFHIKLIADELQQVYERWERGEKQADVLINVPPGSSKSTIVTQLFPVWLWVRNPAIRIISASYSHDLSIEHAVKSRDCLKSDKFQKVYPGLVRFKEDSDGKSAYKNTKKGERYTASTGSKVTGKHADFIFIDDPINPEQSVSDTSRDKANRFVNNTLSSRKTDKNRTVTVMVMQRLHAEDPAGIWLARKKELNHICLPAELADNVKPASAKQFYQNGLLDPKRLGPSAIQDAKTNNGSYGYAGQFGQNPAPAEGGLLKKHWFQKATWQQFLTLTTGEKVIWEFDADTAYRNNSARDPSALMASAFVNNTLYIREVTQQWLELPQLLRYIDSFVERNGYTQDSKLYIEPKASGISVVQMIRANTVVNVMEAPSPGAGEDKVSRVNAVTPFVEGLRVVLIDGSWNQEFIEQCSVFPNAPHDDMVDCLSQRINRILQQQQQPQKRKANVY